MSKYHKKSVVCSYCKKEYPVQIWESVNAQLNPEMKKKLLDGRLYETVCPHCGGTIHCVYDFFYHDMDLKYMIAIQRENAESMDFFPFPDEYKLRLVRDIDELAEKVRIFDQGLNDIAIETTKMIVKEISHIKSKLLFLAEDNAQLQFIMVENEKVMMVPDEIYTSAFKCCTEEELEGPKTFARIDESYIRKQIGLTA